MKTSNNRFILDVNIILDFLLERGNYHSVSKIIEYLIKNKNGYISSSSLSTIYYTVRKYKKKLLKYLPKILGYFQIWKTPSYIDWNHPLAHKDIEDYLIHLTAESLNAFVITCDEKFLKLSDRAISPEKFFEVVLENKEDTIQFLDLRKQNLKIYNQMEIYLDSIITSSAFVCGKYVKEFEEKFAEYLKAKFCVGVNSGTSALIAALMAINLKPGDEVIIPVNTFIATAEAVAILGGKPIFVDIHPDYYTIDTDKLEEKITKKTKAIIPVHLYGQCADMDKIMKIAEKYNLYVIEDACQAHGAEYKGKKAGTIGHIGCFSFYPGKNLGSWGEAGACITNDDILAERLYKIRNHGGIKKYEHNVLGANFRMTEFQGAVLLKKLKFLDSWNKKRKKLANLYDVYLKPLEEKNLIKLPKRASYSTHVYHLYVIQVLKGEREEFINYLKKNNIFTFIHYPKLLVDTKPFKEKNTCYPVAKNSVKNIVSLPMGPHLSEKDIYKVCKCIYNYFNYDF